MLASGNGFKVSGFLLQGSLWVRFGFLRALKFYEGFIQRQGSQGLEKGGSRLL